MSYDTDSDCPTCGLPNTDVAAPSYPYCDDLCTKRHQDQKELRSLRLDLLRWNARARWTAVRNRWRSW